MKKKGLDTSILLWLGMITFLGCYVGGKHLHKAYHFSNDEYDISLALNCLDGKFDYLLSMDGQYLYAYDSKKMVQYDLISKVLIKSNQYNFSQDYKYELVKSNQSNQVGLLVFDSREQYNTDQKKAIVFYKIDSALRTVSLDTFYTPKYFHLLDEDFQFETFYEDSINNNYYFNGDFSYLQVVHDGVWDAVALANSFVDIESGRMHYIQFSQNELAFCTIEDSAIVASIKMKEKCNPISFSAQNNSFVVLSESTDDSIQISIFEDGFTGRYILKNSFVPHRFRDGIYSLDANKGVLDVVHWFRPFPLPSTLFSRK